VSRTALSRSPSAVSRSTANRRASWTDQDQFSQDHGGRRHRLRLVDAFIGQGQRPNELPDWERADVVEWLR
jgi:hypothetical protein